MRDSEGRRTVNIEKRQGEIKVNDIEGELNATDQGKEVIIRGQKVLKLGIETNKRNNFLNQFTHLYEDLKKNQAEVAERKAKEKKKDLVGAEEDISFSSASATQSEKTDRETNSRLAKKSNSKL